MVRVVRDADAVAMAYISEANGKVEVYFDPSEECPLLIRTYQAANDDLHMCTDSEPAKKNSLSNEKARKNQSKEKASQNQSSLKKGNARRPEETLSKLMRSSECGSQTSEAKTTVKSESPVFNLGRSPRLKGSHARALQFDNMKVSAGHTEKKSSARTLEFKEKKSSARTLEPVQMNKYDATGGWSSNTTRKTSG